MSSFEPKESSAEIMADGFKKRHASFSEDNRNPLLSTSSPAGIAAASMVTPHRMALLLLKNGPLPIRHITSHLSDQIPGFGNLSLSKQRRLIISALELGDTDTGCVFEKVGWGQWSAREADAETIETRFKLAKNREKDDAEMRYKKKSAKLADRRESITTPENDIHSTRVPKSPNLRPTLASLRRNTHYSLDQAIESSSDEEEDLSQPSEIEVFDLELEKAPTPKILERGQSYKGISKPRRSRLSSFNRESLVSTLDGNGLEGGLDAAALPETINSRSRPRASFSNASSLSRQSFLRSTYNGSRTSVNHTHHSDTDEEDWESIGAASLRRGSILTPPTPELDYDKLKAEQDVAQALLDMKSI